MKNRLVQYVNNFTFLDGSDKFYKIRILAHRPLGDKRFRNV